MLPILYSLLIVLIGTGLFNSDEDPVEENTTPAGKVLPPAGDDLERFIQSYEIQSRNQLISEIDEFLNTEV